MSEPPFRLRDQALVALVFLTRLPVPWPRVWPEGALALASWAFALVGLVVGGIGALAGLLALRLGEPAAIAAFAALAATILATGALHEDGLADSADGLGGATRARKLEIMQDSRIGSYGVIALLLGLGLRASALTALAGSPGRFALALLAAHAASRAGLPALMRLLPPARPGGLGASAGVPSLPAARMAAAGGGIIAAILLSIWAPVAAAAALAGIAILARKQLGGYTGDVLGAAQQAAELAVLLVAAAA